MEDKNFKKFVIFYFINIAIIIISVVILILAAQNIIPYFFTYVGLGLLLIDVIGFDRYTRKLK